MQQERQDAATKKRLLEQAARDLRVEAEYRDYDTNSMSPEAVLESVGNQFNITPNAVVAALSRRAAIRCEMFVDPRTL